MTDWNSDTPCLHSKRQLKSCVGKSDTQCVNSRVTTPSRKRRPIRSAAATVGLLVLASMVLTALPALATAPTVTAQVLPVVQGLSSPLGDVSIVEGASGQIPTGDVITYRFLDGSSGSTIHLNSTPAVGGTHGLSATAVVASSSGTLNDEVIVTIMNHSTGAFAGVLTLTGLTADIDSGAANGNDIVRVSDSSSVIASSGSPATASDANAVGLAPRSIYSAVGMPTISSTGFVQPAGDLTITEPAKLFFHTGDIITFAIHDSLGSSDTVGLAGTPTVSGGGMLVSVMGLTGGSVQPNDTGFKVSIDQQDPSNGSASTLQVSNLVYNTGQAPAGAVTVTATVTTGSTTEYIYPGRVANAAVGGNTSTTSAGQPIVQVNAANQPAANLTIIETPGTLKVGTTVTVDVQEAGVKFTTAPLMSVTSGDIQFASATATLDGTKQTATWTVSQASTMTSTMVVGPVFYDVASSGPVPGDLVNLLVSGGNGSAFTSQTVPDAMVAPSGLTLFTPASAPPTPATAGNIIYTEVAGQQAPTGGSIVLVSPYATQILAYRTTFAAIPSASVTSGSGLVLGTPTVNTSPITVVTQDGPITAPAETAAIFPVTTGSTSPATVTFTGISYKLGALVPPGGLVATGVLDSGPAGSGTNLAGNDLSNAVNPTGLGGGGGTPVYQPDGLIKGSRSFVGNNVYNTTGLGQTVRQKVHRGKKFVFTIEVQNDGNNADTFTLKGPGARPGFIVRYLNGTTGLTNITSQVTAGTFMTLPVGPTGVTTVRLVVVVKSTAKVGTGRAWLVLATSSGDSTKKDAVKAIAAVT
jgi:hypothetical protein